MSESKAVTRDAIFAKPPEFKRERIEVPQWGGFVYIKQVSAKDFEGWQEWAMKQENAKNPLSARVKFITDCVCDENGKDLFTEPVDVNVLTEHPNDVIDLLWNECRRVNGLDAKSREDAEKN